ncbi:MAG: hypothetical protein ACREMN_06670 [Gemmatimonadales bacterium]
MLLAACRPPPLPPLVPMPLVPASRDSAVAWTRATTPRTPTLIRFRWSYQDERVRYTGRGSARIAPPDSLRFDYVGPLGFGSGAAVLIADSVAWADPEQNFRSLVPAIPMLWAALGIVQPPAPDAAVFTATDSAAAGRRIWRFIRGGDTLSYVASTAAGSGAAPGGAAERAAATGGWLDAEWRRSGQMLARGHCQLDAQGRPARARVDFPEGPARFELQVVAVDTAAVLAPAMWRSRR